MYIYGNPLLPMSRLSSFKRAFRKENLEYAQVFLTVLAFLIGGYWTYYIFKYQYQVLPETEPTSLVLKSSIEYSGSLDSLDFYDISLSIANKSKSRIKIPASFYNVTGMHVGQYENPSRRFPGGILRPDSVYLNNYFSYDTSSSVIIQTDRILDDDSYISPESEFNVHHSFAIPNNRFDVLVITTSSISSKKDAGIAIKWASDNIGRISAYPFIIKNHWFRQNDTIPYNMYKDKPLAEKYDLYFTNISNDYFTRNNIRQNKTATAPVPPPGK